MATLPPRLVCLGKSHTTATIEISLGSAPDRPMPHCPGTLAQSCANVIGIRSLQIPLRIIGSRPGAIPQTLQQRCATRMTVRGRRESLYLARALRDRIPFAVRFAMTLRGLASAAKSAQTRRPVAVLLSVTLARPIFVSRTTVRPHGQPRSAFRQAPHFRDHTARPARPRGSRASP